MATMKTLNGYGFNATELNGKAPEYYIQPRNLLDNSDFTNPVNQRGQTSYSIKGYTIDRWWTYNDLTINLTNNGIVLDGTTTTSNFTQIFDNLPSGIYTFAAKANNNIYTRVFEYSNETITVVDSSNSGFSGSGYLGATVNSAGHPSVFIATTSGNTNTVEWAALYEGSYTADTLPPYVPKGYAAELAECQRYYIEIGSQPVNGWCYDWGEVRFFVPTPTLMRQEKPSVILNTASPNFFIGSTSYNATLIDGKSISNGMLVKYSHAAAVRGQCIIPEFSAKISADL